MLKFKVLNSEAGRRIDLYLTSKITDLSRSHIQKLFAMDKILVNSKPYPARYKLKSGDNITVNFETQSSRVPEINIQTIYEDNECIVINKPVGVLTHSKGSFNPEATVATWLAPKLRDLSGERGGIVHRLDRATSGVMICAKTDEALKYLQKQFSQRKVKKTYLAIIEGELSQKEAIINMPIERNPKHPSTFRPGPNGKEAITKYKVVSENNNYCLVELMPTTGRTHQLRVHLKAINHPIVGDSFYGGKAYDRLMLHASSLEITLPNKKRKIFKASTPKEFNMLINKEAGLPNE